MSQRTPAVEPPHGSPAPATFPPAWLGWAAAAVGAVAVLVAVRMRPPAPAGTDAPAAEFSAGRAAAMLLELCPDGAPHPVGSEAAAAVRARVAAAFEALGAAVEEQREFVCAADRPACGTVSNVLARLPGTAAGPAVLLAAHYDSVPAGPGISDDLAAVAVLLETARTLGAGPRPANAVIFLVDDGEEAGLLGARAFVARHRWARDVGVVVNQEARGTSGLSLMFETSDENAWLIDAYARAVRRPAALSLTAEVYRRLPNDTDLTVFKGAGMAGLNFAFIGDVSRYHTPL
ncbi:MAG TPA: M20/M25/M40 family metallo-hydrolase, partial [Thermoanaerobaculaceae bacterium]|nr:M20/M25/M40 family metallo-hydrolase [Thermoanaerobaculaceae bacterium]